MGTKEAYLNGEKRYPGRRDVETRSSSVETMKASGAHDDDLFFRLVFPEGLALEKVLSIYIEDED